MEGAGREYDSGFEQCWGVLVEPCLWCAWRFGEMPVEHGLVYKRGPECVPRLLALSVDEVH